MKLEILPKLVNVQLDGGHNRQVLLCYVPLQLQGIQRSPMSYKISYYLLEQIKPARFVREDAIFVEKLEGVRGHFLGVLEVGSLLSETPVPST